MSQFYKFCNLNTREINYVDLDMSNCVYSECRELHQNNDREIMKILNKVALVNDWPLQSIVAVSDHESIVYIDIDGEIMKEPLARSPYADDWVQFVWTDVEYI